MIPARLTRAWAQAVVAVSLLSAGKLESEATDSPQPGWLDQTQATLDAGTIGKWTGRGRF